MDSKMNALKSEYNKISDEISNIDNAIKILSEHGILYDTDLYNKVINDLNSKLSELDIKILEYIDTCKHDYYKPYIYEDILKCSKCGNVVLN